MSESVILNDLGTTELVVQIVRPSTTLEVTSPESVTTMTVQMTARTVIVEVIGGPPGGRGDKGDPGVKGDKGDPGVKGDKGSDPLIYHPPQASQTWLISHNLGRFPIVQVVLTTGETVGCRVVHLDNNVVSVEFGAATSGTAILT